MKMSSITFLFFFLLLGSGQFLSREKAVFRDILKSRHLKDPLAATNRSESHGVCLFVQTKIDISTWKTEKWIESFFFYMRDVLIRSIVRQCNELVSCPLMKTFTLFIKADGYHDKFLKFIEYVEQVTNARVFSEHARIRNFNEAVAEVVEQNDCMWLSFIWIDADDAFLDGYFYHVTSEATKILLETRTARGLPWRGAVFGSRTMPRFILGKNRCWVEEVPTCFYSGHSQGQGFILRKTVWELMTRKYVRRGHHTKLLETFRTFVMHGLGFKEYSSRTGVRWTGNEKQIAHETRDAAESRIMFIDISREWNTSAIFIQTPFSSHFPWSKWRNFSVCDSEQKQAVQQKYSQDLTDLIDHVPNLDFEIADACMNNMFFRNKSPHCLSFRSSI